jgi:hypothetical protein
MTKAWGGFTPNRIVTPDDFLLMGISSTANRNSRNVLACQLRANQSVPNVFGWPGPGPHFVVIIIISRTPPFPSSRLNVFFQEFLVLARMAIIHRKLAITPTKI